MDGSAHGFLHPTIQEFLAAYHVMSLPAQQQKEHLKKLAAKSNTALAIRFTAGLTRYQQSSETLYSFADTFNPGQKEDTGLVERLHRLFETQRPGYIQSVLGNSEQSFCCEAVSLSSFDLYSLGYCIAHSGVLWHIALRQCGLTDEHVRMLVQAEKGKAFHHIKSFSCTSCDLTASGIVLLGEARDVHVF